MGLVSYQKPQSRRNTHTFSYEDYDEIVVVGRKDNMSKILARGPKNVITFMEYAETDEHSFRRLDARDGDSMRGSLGMSSGRFSTAQIADFFGCVESRIYEWIQQGRFDGVIHEGSDVLFSAQGNWITRHGERVSLRELEVDYIQRERERVDGLGKNLDAELRELSDKYGGDFESAFGERDSLTPDQRRDKVLWNHLLQLKSEVQGH